MTVFFKEFVYFTFDYLEHFKGESGESFNLKKNKPSEASGSGVQPESSASGGKSSNSEKKPSEASGSGAQPESSDDIPISED
jgi:hypothetical protein